MVDQQVETYKNYVGGHWLDSGSGQTYTITSPASKSTVLGAFQFSTPEDVAQAVAAAQEALSGWAATPAPARAQFLYRALDIMRQRSEDTWPNSSVDKEGANRCSTNLERAVPKPSVNFINTLPTNPSHTITSARPVKKSMPSTLPMKLRWLFCKS